MQAKSAARIVSCHTSTVLPLTNTFNWRTAPDDLAALMLWELSNGQAVQLQVMCVDAAS
jgi:hypothetical protein